MRCQWQSIFGVLPLWIRQEADKHCLEDIEELRLRLGTKPLICSANHHRELSRNVAQEDLQHIINVASQYSLWAASTVSKGYLTLSGGHRIGIAGDIIIKNGTITGVRWVSSLCIRIAKDLPGIAKGIPIHGSVLVIGSPGSGKTTLLRDIIRTRSDSGPGSVCVIDERCEIFPVTQERFCFCPGTHTDVVSGCSKQAGLEIAIRSMGPQTVAVDEITAQDDCEALIQAGWCGVDILATAHAGCRKELFARPVYKPLLEMKLFDTLVILNRDKSYHTERMT